MQTSSNAENLERLQSYLAQDPENPNLLSDIAHLNFVEGNRSVAEATARQAIAAGADIPLPFNLLGLISSDAGDMASASELFSQSHQLGERDPYILFRYAQALALMRKFSESEPLAREAAADPQRAPDAEALLVRVLHYLGQVPEAIAVAEAAIEQGRASARLHSMLSTLYLDNEDFDKSAEACRLALALAPNDPEARAAQGLISLKQLSPAEALEDFRQAIHVAPTHGRAHLGEGLALMLNGDMVSATSSITRATECMPTHVGTYQALAWCQILNKDVAGAESTLNKAFELNRNFAETHGGLAIVSLMRGNLIAAKKYAQQAHRLDPDSVSGKFAQVLIQQANGNSGKAEEMMQTLLTQPIMSDGQSIQQAVATFLAKNS
ncbi:MAG: tetratricopeptide repeat protein [Rhodocyclaceae bacterium]